MSVCEKLHVRGMTVVMITHFMDEAARADRVVVIDRGEIALDGTPEDILTRADELMKLSLEMPFASELACRLRQLGVPVSATVSADELEEELCRLLSRA